MVAFNTPDYSALGDKAFEVGRRRAVLGRVQNALQANDLTGAQNALTGAGYSEDAAALGKIMQTRQQEQARQRVGQLSRTDPAAAQREAVVNGLPELATGLQGVDKAQADARALHAQQIGGIAHVLATLPMEQRSGVWAQAAQRLRSAGALDPGEENIDLSDAGLHVLQVGAIGVLKQMESEQHATDVNKPILTSPGQKLVRPDGSLIFGNPEKPEYKALGQGESLVEVGGPPQGAAPAQAPAGGAPRGLRNNNPLNLRPLAQGQWAGQTGVDQGPGGGYAQFGTPQDGWNAAHKNLEAYAGHGINTIAGVVSRWAPAGDGSNNPQAYAATVSKALGVPADQPIDLHNPQVREKLLTAMAGVENGQPAAPATSAQGGARIVAQGAPKAQVRTLTPQEVQAKGLPAGTVAEVDEKGHTNVISKKSDRITDGQRQTAAFAYRAFQANDRMNELVRQGIAAPTAQSLVTDGKGNVSLVLKNQRDRQFYQAARDWLAPILRKDTGAAVTDSELATYMDVYIPRYGDGLAVLKQKAQARHDAMTALSRQGAAAFEDQYGNRKFNVSYPGASTSAGGAPKPGQVVKGFRFKGGDPSKPQSWVKV